MVAINFFFSSSFACQNLPDFQSLPPAPEVSRSFQISWLPSAGSKLQVDLSGPNAVKLFVMSNFRYTYCKPWPYFDAIFIHYFKAHSHLLKQSSDSEGDCQCRYWNFSISLQQRNCLHQMQHQMQPAWMSLHLQFWTVKIDLHFCLFASSKCVNRCLS